MSPNRLTFYNPCMVPFSVCGTGDLQIKDHFLCFDLFFSHNNKHYLYDTTFFILLHSPPFGNTLRTVPSGGSPFL